MRTTKWMDKVEIPENEKLKQMEEDIKICKKP